MSPLTLQWIFTWPQMYCQMCLQNTTLLLRVYPMCYILQDVHHTISRLQLLS